MKHSVSPRNMKALWTAGCLNVSSWPELVCPTGVLSCTVLSQVKPQSWFRASRLEPKCVLDFVHNMTPVVALQLAIHRALAAGLHLIFGCYCVDRAT